MEFLLLEVPVAFSARLSENTVADDDPVVFETVDLNVGEGYDEFSGKTIQIFFHM